MKIKQLIAKLERDEPRWSNERYGKEVLHLLLSLRNQNPNNLVQMHNGECERDGVYVPFDENGNLDYKKARPFREGEAFRVFPTSGGTVLRTQHPNT